MAVNTRAVTHGHITHSRHTQYTMITLEKQVTTNHPVSTKEARCAWLTLTSERAHDFMRVTACGTNSIGSCICVCRPSSGPYSIPGHCRAHLPMQQTLEAHTSTHTQDCTFTSRHIQSLTLTGWWCTLNSLFVIDFGCCYCKSKARCNTKWTLPPRLLMCTTQQATYNKMATNDAHFVHPQAARYQQTYRIGVNRQIRSIYVYFHYSRTRVIGINNNHLRTAGMRQHRCGTMDAERLISDICEGKELIED